MAAAFYTGYSLVKMAEHDTSYGVDNRLGKPGLVVDGRYRLDVLLGAGGFGEVWRASQQVEGSDVRPVALKLLHAPTTGTGMTPTTGPAVTPGGSGSTMQHRWLDEVRAVRDVRCDSIATIFDVGISREPRMAFIAMQLLTGETLDERLKRGVVYWRRALAITRKVVAALAACHHVGVTHCDLKPQNVYLADEGVYVVDFGVAALGGEVQAHRQLAERAAAAAAQAAQSADADDLMMGTGAVSLDEVPGAAPPQVDMGGLHVFGTPGYIPPEAYRGEPPGPASDAFAVGVMLYVMLTGRLPQRVEADLDISSIRPSKLTNDRYQAAVNSATVREDFTPITEYADDVPDSVVELIGQLMASDPQARPVDDLVDLVEEVYARPYGVPDPPYCGLAAFDARRAGYIAGRVADIEDVTASLRHTRAVVLAGPSGCGKSSLAIAGVAPRIDQQLFDDTDGWRLHTLRPSEGGDVIAITDDHPDAADGSLGTLVVVDQLEEVLRLDEAAAEEFCAALAALAEGSDNVRVRDRVVGAEQPVRVIATIRDDLFGRVAALPALRRFPERNLYTVRGVEPNAMDAIVKAPAQAAGYKLEGAEGVVAEAVALVNEDAGALPLVQFALTRWWEARDEASKTLTREEWQKIGGIEGSLAETAQALFDAFGSLERDQMRDILLALFRPDGTRRGVPETELVYDEASRGVLDTLVERRLVTRHTDSERGNTLEVVHEALGRRWPLLRNWLDETRVERELIHDAQVDAERWRRAGEPAELLWRGGRLAAVVPLEDKLGEAAEFISRAANVAGRQRWTRRGLFGLMAALAAVAVVLVLSYAASNRARRNAQEARKVAEEQRGKAIAANSQMQKALQRNVTLREKAQQEESRAKGAAERAKKAEDKARAEASKNDRLRQDAERAKEKAVEQEKKARAAEAVAEGARKKEVALRQDADEQRRLARELTEKTDRLYREAQTWRGYYEAAKKLHELSGKQMDRERKKYERLRKRYRNVQRSLQQCKKAP